MSAGVTADPSLQAVEAGIGPNAITRIVEALQGLEGGPPTAKIMELAKISAYLSAPPQAMVRQSEVIALHDMVRTSLGPDRARTITWIAGQRTGDYLLAHRIPKLVQRVLQWLPARLAARVLLVAIARHAWTFTGSGRMSYRGGHPVEITVHDCVLCQGHQVPAPTGFYYAAVFERLFRALVHPMSRVVETRCMATGDPACVFEVTWTASRRSGSSCAVPPPPRRVQPSTPPGSKDLNSACTCTQTAGSSCCGQTP